MELEDYFIGVGERRLEKFDAVAEICAFDDGLELSIEVEAGEGDEDVGISGVDDFGGCDHVGVPDAPVVGCCESGVVGWVAEFVAHADAC